MYNYTYIELLDFEGPDIEKTLLVDPSLLLKNIIEQVYKTNPDRFKIKCSTHIDEGPVETEEFFSSLSVLLYL